MRKSLTNIDKRINEIEKLDPESAQTLRATRQQLTEGKSVDDLINDPTKISQFDDHTRKILGQAQSGEEGDQELTTEDEHAQNVAQGFSDAVIEYDPDEGFFVPGQEPVEPVEQPEQGEVTPLIQVPKVALSPHRKTRSHQHQTLTNKQHLEAANAKLAKYTAYGGMGATAKGVRVIRPTINAWL